MSDLIAKETSCKQRPHQQYSAILQLLEPSERDLGGFSVRRFLPSKELASVGPFIFFDHLGPAVFPPRPGYRRAAAPTHRVSDRHLRVCRRDPAPRQPR